MKKMKKLKICLASGLAFVSMLGGIFVGSWNALAESAPEAQKASSLWEEVDGITLEDNVDVPDYMKYGRYANSFKGEQNIIEITSDEEQNLEPWELNGLKITSDMDDKSISYKHTLDLNGLTTADEFLTFAPIPAVQSAQDYTEIEILLEDADDASNYVKVTFTHYTLWAAGTRVLVTTPNISASSGPTLYIGAFKGLTTDAYQSGTNFRHRPIKMRYDVQKKVVSVVGEAGELKEIRDLDDESDVGYGKAWEGFKNNRVNLTITMRGFVAQEAQVMILNVCGQEMNGATLVDKAAPKFSFEEQAAVQPTAQVGKQYSLFEAQCWDVVSGNRPYDVTVLSPSGKNVEVADGAFVPTESGYYRITYTASDAVGNVANKEFKILATNALSPITIEAETASGSYLVGKNIPVYEPSAQGGSGILDITTEVVRIGGGERVTISEGEFKPMLGGTYCVIYTATDYLGNKGTKTITYEVETTESVIVESITELTRLFDGVQVRFPQPIAYDYVTLVGNKLNAKYEISVYDKQNAKELLTDGVFTPDLEQYGESVKVEYVIYANNDATKTKAITYTYDVPLYSREIDERTVGQIEDYFVFDKEAFTTSYNPDNESEFLKFYTEQVATSHSISFANPLLADGFYVSFVLPAGEQNFGSLTISLRDSINSQIGFDLELYDTMPSHDKDYTTFVRSGGVRYAMNGTGNKFAYVANPKYDKDNPNGEEEYLRDPETGEYLIEEVSSRTPMSLEFKDGKVVDYSGHVVLRPKVGFDGKSFNGFPSGKTYVTFTFKDVTGASSLMLSQICTQMLYVEYEDDERVPFTDTSEPMIVLSEDVRNDYLINQMVKVPAAMGFDVVTPNVDVYVTVKSPSGRLVYNRVLANEDLYFLLDSQGKYTITYEAEDADNGTRKVYTIKAKDVTPPTIAVAATALEGRVGKTTAIPTAILLDDVDQTPRLYIMIITPKGTIITLGERTEENEIASYTFTEKGTYYIRYYALDNTYNASFTDIPVVVS